MEYQVKINRMSKELDVKEKIKIKDTSNGISLDALSKEVAQTGEKIVVDVDYFVMLDVHNEHSEQLDYETCVIMDKTGVKYYTSSKPFITQFLSIADEIIEAEIDDWQVEVYRKNSNTNKDRQFISCSIV